jgi:PAS domain S-box-containing protein
MFKRGWDSISNLGLQNSISTSVSKRIKLTNQLVAFALAITVIYSFIFIYWNIQNVFKIEASAFLIYFTVFVLSYFRQYLLARFLFIGGLFIHLFALCLIFGESSQIHLLFIPIAATPLILFDLKEIRVICFLIALAVTTFLMLYLLNFSTSFSVSLPEPLVLKMRITFNITAILAEVIVIYSFIKNFEKTEKTLDASNELLQQQLQAIFENSFDALFLVDWNKRKIIKANDRSVELFGMDDKQEFYDKYGIDLHKEMPSEQEMQYMRDNLNTKGSYEGEILYKRKNGTEFWGALAIKLVLIGDQKYQSVRVRDITEEKKAKALIQSSLHEKEILLSEIHHRVKNNMAVISGLLGLQSSYVDDSQLQMLFEESRNRIHSMALIHDKLYQHETFARIDFNAYCNDLLTYISSSYNASSTKVSYKVSCKDIFIDIKNAVPCGLILNELISNAYKHAFKERETGEITIVCTKMGGKLTMMVSDNGIGFEPGNTLQNPVSLGLTLITALVDQVGGDIKITNKNGTTFYISFEE